MSGNGEEDWLVALEQQEQNQLSSKVSQIYALHDFKIYLILSPMAHHK